MSETPKCPYCGAETRLNENNEGIYWYECRECNATGPTEKTPVEAFSAALHRAEPENRPLTLNEVKTRCKRPLEADPLFLEFKREGNRCRWTLGTIVKTLEATELTGDYGKSYRCWPRKPTPEQMQAEKWEE